MFLSQVSGDTEVWGRELLVQRVVEEEGRAAFHRGATVVVLDVQKDAQSAGRSVVGAHHGASEQQAQDACGTGPR